MSSCCCRLCLQAFTVVTVFNAMTFALKVTPFSVKSLAEASVAIDRFKVRDVTSSLPSLSTCFLWSSWWFSWSLPDDYE